MIGAIIAKRRVRAAFDSLNRGDVNSFLASWADDATWVYPGDIPSASGTIRGKTAIEKWFQRFVDQYAKINFMVKNVFVANQFALGGTNVLAVEWDVTFTDKQGHEIPNTGVSTVTLKGGRAIHAQDYIFDADNLRRQWGLKPKND